jgi:hypothetical protein
MASIYESELETELEQELHELHEGSLENELGEGSGENEGILGTIGNVLGGLLGEQESEFELESEGGWHELEMESELESGEHFFKGIGSFLKKAAPILKSVAKVAAPMVGTAIGGPFGAVLGQLASSALGESELESEFEMQEFELELESESEMAHEQEQEALHEIANHELTEHEAIAEMMAEAASQEQHEGQAEAMAGAAGVTVISPADRRALRAILPHITRGVAILTRILRRRRMTRPVVRAIPTIVRRTVKSLKRQAAAGTPITRRTAGKTAALQVKRVLGSPRLCAAAMTRNMKSSRAIRRSPAKRVVRG